MPPRQAWRGVRKIEPKVVYFEDTYAIFCRLGWLVMSSPVRRAARFGGMVEESEEELEKFEGELEGFESDCKGYGRKCSR